jgi:hypothetical protein
MKTKPVSLRFNEDDLTLAINKSGIRTPQKLIDFLLSEYVRNLKPQYYQNDLKDADKWTTKAPLSFQKPPKEAYGGSEINKVMLDKAKVYEEFKNQETTLFDVKEIEKRIKELEAELKSPPKSPIIGMKRWKQIREDEINKLRNK